MHGTMPSSFKFLLIIWLLGSLPLSCQQSIRAETPIEHVVVIFQENQSFDHYFATYPMAANLPGEPSFHPAEGTPTVNGLPTVLRTRNPNLEQPWRVARNDAVSIISACDNDHGYTAEQEAYHLGLLDRFVQFTGSRDKGCSRNFVMAYLDGNTVTALWNYAQHFALSDNFFGTTFGPSMVGAINLVSAQTAGAVPENAKGPGGIPYTVDGTMVGNPPAAFDDCAEAEGTRVRMTGKNIGDLLNASGITWGWFSAGFAPTSKTTSGTAICNGKHLGSNGQMLPIYDDPDPFEYYQSTANPHHVPPATINSVGRTDQAQHQYDLDMFWQAAASGHLPSVIFLRGPEYTDGHPGYSDPLAEQQFLVNTINSLQRLPEWRSMAIFLTWDDSDGWYDHVMPPILNQSQIPTLDRILGPQGLCGSRPPLGGQQGRCAYGPRIPLLIISPFSRVNFVDHSLTDQSSIIRFIEDNWHLGRIGNGSLDIFAGSFLGSFDFEHPHTVQYVLDPETGETK